CVSQSVGAAADPKEHNLFYPKVYFVGDSWTSEMRLISDHRVVMRFEEKYMTLGNHQYVSSANQVLDMSIVKNYSGGGLTMQGTLASSFSSNRATWASDVPGLTVLHLGAYDINTYLGNSVTCDNDMRQAFPQAIKSFIIQWEADARQRAQHVQEFTKSFEQHRWLIVSPPTWGNFILQEYMDADAYRRMRANAVKGLHRARSSLWTEHRAAVIFPSITPSGQWHNNHLKGISMTDYAEELFKGASSMMCTHCAPTNGSYLKSEHLRLLQEDCILLQEADGPGHH
ncbi:unnamed protein product, partial [Meganyctiphanes norvegica]